jgi:hypothetical protein
MANSEVTSQYKFIQSYNVSEYYLVASLILAIWNLVCTISTSQRMSVAECVTAITLIWSDLTYLFLIYNKTALADST